MGCLLCGDKKSEKNSACETCGSLPRDREVAQFLQKLPLTHAKVLEVGPASTQLSDLLQVAKYTAIDVRDPQFEWSKNTRFMIMDVTKMSFSDQFFDLILCNHVLPYIRSDYQAMSEIHRCLKGTGMAMLNAEVLAPKTVRASEGQANYREREWVYGEDFYERLEAAGFFVHREGDFILCFKFRDTMNNFLQGLR